MRIDKKKTLHTRRESTRGVAYATILWVEASHEEKYWEGLVVVNSGETHDGHEVPVHPVQAFGLRMDSFSASGELREMSTLEDDAWTDLMFAALEKELQEEVI